MTAPTISVLLPVYNAAPYIAEAVQSVLDQQDVDLELIIVDDGSTDETAQVLGTFTDPRIRYVRHTTNRGLVAALNEGLDLAQGTLIARMDADDIMLPGRLAEQEAFLKAHPEIDLVAAHVELMNAAGETTGVWDTDRAVVSEAEIHAMMPRTNCLAHPTVMMRRSAVEGLRYRGRHEDWDLWMQLLARGKRLSKIPEVMLRQRVHATSYMGSLKGRIPLERRLLRSRREFLWGEWSSGYFAAFHFKVLHAQIRTLGRHLKNNVATPFLRNLKRVLSYSPVALYSEHRALKNAASTWTGDHVFLFPYLNTGGAEQVHADILATISDHKPLIAITGFSRDRAFASNFAKHGTLLELPRLLNHPFTRKGAGRRLAALINARPRAVLFSSNTTTFFHLLPFLDPAVRTYTLIHAFLYQTQGNQQHKDWLPLFDRVNAYIFISQRSKAEYERFLFNNNIPRSHFDKLQFISNAVEHFGDVQTHERTGILFVGRPSPEKRLELFLTLCDRLEIDAPGRFRFTVVGSVPVTGHPHVQFMGRINDPQALIAIYQEHDLLVLTSTREGFPLVIMEAMAQGLAILSTPVGDVPVRVTAEEAVISSSIEADSVLQEFVEAVLQLDRDRDRLQRMKAAALSKARTEFDPARSAASYRALLIRP